MGRDAGVGGGLTAMANLDWIFWMPVMVGALVAGASMGMMGTVVVGMRAPFLGVCVSHAALAGAVFASLAGAGQVGMLAAALGGSTITALALGLADPDRLKMDTNVMLGLLFTTSMGLAFLGIGLHQRLGISDHDVRALLWGSLLLCDWPTVGLTAAVLAVAAAFMAGCHKELRAMMFSRRLATASGVAVTGVWVGFLLLISATVTVSFQAVGGLMIYSLMANPAAAAFQLVRGYGRTLALATALGAVSGLGGFLISAATDLPTGAVIVLLSAALVAVAAMIRRLRAA